MTKIFHNPRCSKSRQALQLLRDQGIEPEVVEYLKTPPDAKQLKKILALLQCEARQLLRRKETAYRENHLDNPELTEDQIIELMVSNPVLIERPIVIHGKRAVLGRPPENVLDVLR